MSTPSIPHLTRRAIIGSAAVVAAAAALPSSGWAAGTTIEPAAAAAATPVVTFYMDGLIVDETGKSPPYRPPNGLRSAAPIEHLSDIEIRWLHGWA
jgi:hypothetical protein